jgi:hypothetical protein
MRLNGSGALTLEDARTWLEETGLCVFMPRRHSAATLAPSFVDAIAGRETPNPDPKQIAHAEDLLVRLEKADVAVRLNLLGQPGEHPDFIVATWVLPYVYALRGDRDWRRTPQLTGSRQVSPLAIQAYKLLETGEKTIPQLKHALGREVTEQAVLRAITELWQQLRIIPVVDAPGTAAKWQLLRVRFQKAIAEGASTSQVTAISVLASIFLQAVIAAGMEDVELFLSPLTARSKVREVLRGLVATRQVHTLSVGHAPHYYVAGTLPEFAPASAAYTSTAISASSYFLHSYERDEEHEPRHQTLSLAASAEKSSHIEPVKPASVASDSDKVSAPAAAREHKPAQPASGRTAARRPAEKSHGDRHAKHGTGHGVKSPAHRGHASSSSSTSSRTGRSQSSSSARKPAARGAHSAAKPGAKTAAGARSKRPHTVAAGAKTGGAKRFGFSGARTSRTGSRTTTGAKKRG